MDEKSIVEQARNDPDAFALLYERYIDRIFSFIYRRSGDREPSEDIISASFEAALKYLASYRWQEAYDWVSLVTCRGYNLLEDSYEQRVVARAVLISTSLDGEIYTDSAADFGVGGR